MLVKGTKITCPECGSHIATVKRNLDIGEMSNVNDFEFVSGHEKRNGDRADCMMCGTPYIGHQYNRGHCIHTEVGWWPEERRKEDHSA